MGFRKYLEKNGIITQLTRVLVGLYEEPERPANAIDYIKKYLGAPTGVDIEELRAENDELKRQNAELEAKVASLTTQLKELQAEQGGGACVQTCALASRQALTF